MMPILEPITAGIIVSLLNSFLLPRLAQCFESVVDTDEGSDCSENSAINADTEVHIHTHLRRRCRIYWNSSMVRVPWGEPSGPEGGR